MFKVYILYSEKIDRYYIGQTWDFTSRLMFHNDLEKNKIWTGKGIPWITKAIFSVSSRKEALHLERFIKSRKSREFIENIIQHRKIIFNHQVIAADPD